MHKRKRTWSQRAFKYWTRPTGDLPQSVWDQARAQQRLWNTLVTLRTDTREGLMARADAIRAWCPQPEPLLAADKKDSWARFEAAAKQAVADSGLNWEDGPGVYERFKVACPTKKNRKGEPQLQTRLEKMTLLHRFTGGGVPVGQLQSTRAWRFRLGQIPAFAWEDNSHANRDRRFTRGWWGLDEKDGFHFDIKLHRALPPEAIVKRVVWSGRLHRVHGWEWAVCVTVEEPPVLSVRRTEGTNFSQSDHAGLDLGWRVGGEGAWLRIGMVTDSAGRTLELRLPLQWTEQKALRHQDRFREHGQTFYPHRTFRDIAELDGLIGDAVEDCKGQLKRLLPTLPPGFVQMRQRGLFGLKDQVETLSDNPAQRDAIQEVLTVWEARNKQLRRWKIVATDRAIGQRRMIYRRLAHWLTQQYEKITWEGDLSLKSMAEEEDKEVALDASMRYRQIAALSELRLYLQQSAVKNGCELVAAPAAQSTITCWVCGGAIVPGAARVLTCEQAHRQDQDVNAARNLLSFGQNGDAVSPSGTGGTEHHVIPDFLRTVAVNCTPEDLV
jgi:Putative transposase DNA-binding domain